MDMDIWIQTIIINVKNLKLRFSSYISKLVLSTFFKMQNQTFKRKPKKQCNINL